MLILPAQVLSLLQSLVIYYISTEAVEKVCSAAVFTTFELRYDIFLLLLFYFFTYKNSER